MYFEKTFLFLIPYGYTEKGTVDRAAPQSWGGIQEGKAKAKSGGT
jgi:hypothetical protein